jgi:FMN-dependent oxidoreductase (nitrilotriacetate monooxygenase family)
MRDRPKMKFSVFMMMDGSYHLGGWRHPHAYADSGFDITRWIEFAQILERGKLDMLFIADTISPPGADNTEALSNTARAFGFEPLTLIAALSQVTKHLGLAATAATTWSQPYNLARMFASIDNMTKGRAGWNLVTGRNPGDALNFSEREHMAHADRYALAEEFIDVVEGLWDTFDDDAFIRDRKTGRFFDPAKFHMLNHKGEHFSVRGPLSVPRPVQGHPVVIQAGASEPARELSARVADMVFTAQSSLENARTFYADVKSRLAKYGRTPDQLKIMPGFNVYIGKTRQEADDKFDQLQELIPTGYAISQLSAQLSVDLSGYPPDGPMPMVEKNAALSNPQLWVEIARNENLTLAQVAKRSAASKAHWSIRGTAKDVADQLEEWFTTGAADGFNLLPAVAPDTLNDFVDMVVPELQRRGLFRTEYEGNTLRENLGLARPADKTARRRARSVAAK